jgi:hypothetical protein
MKRTLVKAGMIGLMTVANAALQGVAMLGLEGLRRKRVNWS